MPNATAPLLVRFGPRRWPGYWEGIVKTEQAKALLASSAVRDYLPPDRPLPPLSAFYLAPPA